MLGCKTKRSNEKKIEYIEFDDKGRQKKENKKFKDSEELESFLHTLQSPYALDDGELINLSSSLENMQEIKLRNNFIVYDIKKNQTLIEKYELLFKDFIETEGNDILIKYPYPIEQICFDIEYFFNLNLEKYPSFFGIETRIFHLYLNLLFTSTEKFFLHLFHRPKSGTTMQIFKILNNIVMNIIYIDLRKLSEILNKFSVTEMKKYIMYSLFWFLKCNNREELNNNYNSLEKFSEEILLSIITKKTNINLFDCVKSYVNFLKSKEGKFILILDHFNNKIADYEYNSIISEKIKLIIVQQIKSSNDIELFFRYIENFNRYYKKSTKGVEFYKNEKTMAYYYETYPLTEYIFKEFEILALYKDELLQNFNYNTQIYFLEFLEFIKQKKQKEQKEIKEKKMELFVSFLDETKRTIKRNIRKFYNNNMNNEIYFISKFYNYYINKNSNNEDKQEKESTIELLGKNLPLEYFILVFEAKKESKKIIEINTCCKLIDKIISEIAQNFSTIIFQSDYYEKTNESEKGHIFENAVIDTLQMNPKLFFFNDDSLFIKFEFIIPSKEKKEEGIDPVEEFYKNQTNIKDYLSNTEINDMENLKKLYNENKTINNIFILQKKPRAKKYDFFIIKFLNNYKFIIFLCQATIRTDTDKFKFINMAFHKDIFYLVSKIEYFFQGYESLGAQLIYILPLQNNEIEIKYKHSIDKNLINNVHLLFFHKNLYFYFENKKILENIFINDRNEMKFQVLDKEKNNVFYGVDLNNEIEAIKKAYNIRIGNVFIISFDDNILGNFLVITKELFLIVINSEIKYKISYKNQLEIIFDYDLNYLKGTKLYFLEILNPEEVSTIHVFQFNFDKIEKK